MKKIPSLFRRDFDGDRSRCLPEVVSGCEWVVAAEGTATRKWDGTCCLVRGDRLYKRYDRKLDPRTGQPKTAPEGWEPCEEAPDPNTNHWPGWLPVRADDPEDAYFAVAWLRRDGLHPTFLLGGPTVDGTYELVGPGINGNPEHLAGLYFVRHGRTVYPDVPRDFEGLRAWFEQAPPIEGIVFWHEDGRMAKVKRRDLGLPWPVPMKLFP